jgi:hypothetical protein
MTGVMEVTEPLPRQAHGWARDFGDSRLFGSVGAESRYWALDWGDAASETKWWILRSIVGPSRSDRTSPSGG